MFRSKDMEMIRLIMSLEGAWDVINFIGTNENAMIAGSQGPENFSMSKSQMAKGKMLEQWNQRMGAIKERCEKFGVRYNPVTDHKLMRKVVERRLTRDNIQDGAILEQMMSSLEEKLKSLENYFKNFDEFTERVKELDYTSAILRNLHTVMPRDMSPFERGSTDIANMEGDNFTGAQDNQSERLANTRLMYYVGLIDTEELHKFQKMVYRITRGKVLVKSQDIGSVPTIFDTLGHRYKSLNPNDTQKDPSKSLLFMFYVGKDSIIGKKLKAITTVFNVYHITLPASNNEIRAMLGENAKNKDELAKVVTRTIDEIHSILESLFRVEGTNGVSLMDQMTYLINREKRINYVISHLEPQNELYSLRLWVDSENKNMFISQLMEHCAKNPNSTKPIVSTIKVDLNRVKPPSKFDLNEFTAPFQQIVETYAIPKYKEINPAPFTAATFPFLYGVMFGDACHGFIIFAFGLYTLMFSNQLKRRGGPWAAIASLRYLITMLGFFSTYVGLTYNDFASMPLIFIESCYDPKKDESGAIVEYTKRDDCVYPFGIDYVWYMSKNEIPFMNSFKMKLSIILGVLQMLFGIILKGFNSVYFGSAIDFLFEVIPQFLFLGGLFGYMGFLIVVKWMTNWEDRTPPAIISVFTSLNKVDPNTCLLGDEHLQEKIQQIIMISCLACSILMFFPKPIILACRSGSNHQALPPTNQRKNSKHHSGEAHFEASLGEQLILDHEDDGQDMTMKTNARSRGSVGSEAADAHDHEGFGELMVHQAIETIEFVLGSISNTASYLRLWALSLAHSQLSKTFLNLLMKGNYADSTSPILTAVNVVPSFIQLSIATTGVLLMMDALECFLHTLRLHWVEFQSKFYKGEGLKYSPLSFGLEE